MTKTPSLPAMTESLQKTVEFHREREAFHAQQQAHHAQQEKLHGEERARHAAEMAAASRHLEELLALTERLGQVVEQVRMVPPEAREETLGRNPKLSHAVDRVLESWPPEVQFTATSIAAEVRRRYGAVLRRDVDLRAIASALRRRRDEGRVQENCRGRPHLEAQYRKAG
jgi:homoaconitase/3-isopropylmalate dehydratase large subunit